MRHKGKLKAAAVCAVLLGVFFAGLWSSPDQPVADSNAIFSADEVASASAAVEKPAHATPVDVLPGSADKARALDTTPTGPDGLFRMFGPAATDVFALFAMGRDSKDPMQKLLASRAYDLCIQYIVPPAYPRQPSFPDGESMRRYVNIRASMQERCAGFHSIGVSELINTGKTLQAWYESESNPMSPNYLDIPRNPSEAELMEVGKRLAEQLRSQGAAAVFSRSGSLADWLDEAAKRPSQYKLAQELSTPINNHAMVLLAMCFSGFDCSASGNLYGMTCGLHGSCEPSFERSVLADAGNEDALAITKQARFLAQVLSSGGLESLGLPPR